MPFVPFPVYGADKVGKVLAWVAVFCLIVAAWLVAIWADRTYWEPERAAVKAQADEWRRGEESRALGRCMNDPKDPCWVKP